ncbi:hypothetical protein Zmor_011872 [Zophobas morio]|uniref:Phospholipase D C-terminal domain-containing protein n=1 Tax=Zophobas morio TaxID=2755281 RepID=A0AA38HLB1_9CUCU|nr:hypothetical protein Zmor_011872 [Zophobas morio]
MHWRLPTWSRVQKWKYAQRGGAVRSASGAVDSLTRLFFADIRLQKMPFPGALGDRRPTLRYIPSLPPPFVAGKKSYYTTDKPWELECIRQVAKLAENNWKLFTQKKVVEMKGHLLVYPMDVARYLPILFARISLSLVTA